jgi:glycosyltransferase involved in cell wall biosynthesis
VRFDSSGQPHARWWSPLRTARLLATHNIIHYHFGASYLGEKHGHLDARVCQKAGKKIIVQFHGSDVRRPSIEKARNPYYVAFDGESDERAIRCLSLWPELTGGHCVISDVGLDAHLADHFPHIHHVPLCVDLRPLALPPREPGAARLPVVVHAPSELEGKGTDSVRAAVDKLTESGYAFRYIELHRRRRADVARATAEADIVVDSLRLGTVGVFALEAMALGKPVICYVEPSLVAKFSPDLPIVNANPVTVQRVLADLLDDPGLRLEIGARSRAYVEREHALSTLGPRLLDIYAGLP